MDASLLLGGAVDCAAGSVLVYPFLSVEMLNIKYYLYISYIRYIFEEN